MYGCADPVIVYGFNIGNRMSKFSNDWLSKNYPDVECYALDIVRCYLGEPVYGVCCTMDLSTGHITAPSEKEMETIKNLYDKYTEYMWENCKYRTGPIELGYHLALYGWDEEDHEDITLD